MALTEAEELELLELENENALSQGNSAPESKGLIRSSAEGILNSPTLPIVGGTIGGIVGNVPGAALGGAAGESFRQIGKRVMGMESPDTMIGAGKDILAEGATMAAGEGVTRYGLPLLKPAGKAIMKTPYVGAGIRSAGNAISDTSGKLFELLTKMKPSDASTLFKNPKAILPGQWKKAQTAWKSAAKEIGLQVDDVSPEMIQILSGDAKKMVFDTYAKLRVGWAVSAAEAQTAKQALDIAVMPVAKTIRKNPLVTTLQKIRSAFTERIGQESKEMAAANKQYGIAATGNKFKSLFPMNTTGTPAVFRSGVLPTLVGAGSYARGDSPIESTIKGAAVGALTSPLSMGTGIALAGGARNLLPYVARPAMNILSEKAKNLFKTKSGHEYSVVSE